MKITEVPARSYIAKSKLGDLCINPYAGCGHGCLYCYAYYMAKWTGHEEEPWGSFVDVRWTDRPIDLEKIKGRDIIIGTVTDPYQPVEERYRVTRYILEQLINSECSITVITKGKLITRDIDLFKKISKTSDFMTMLSINGVDNKTWSSMENTSSIEDRVSALKKLHQSGIKTGVFVAPIIPGMSDWKKVIEDTREFTDWYQFETLSLGGNADHKRNFLRWVLFNRKELWDKYHDVYVNGNVQWIKDIESEVKKYCQDHGIDGGFGGLAPHHLTF